MPQARGLTQSKLNQMRANVITMMLKDTCDLQSPIHSQSDTGEDIINWVVLPLDKNIPCRLDVIQFRTQQIEVYAGKQLITQLYKGYFPWNVNISVEKILVHNGKRYQFRVINDDLSPVANVNDPFSYLENSSGIYKIVHLARLD